MYGWYIDKNGCFRSVGKRNHQVSVRLPQKVYDVICAYRGDTFSEKPVNFVVDHALKDF